MSNLSNKSGRTSPTTRRVNLINAYDHYELQQRKHLSYSYEVET